MNTFFIPKSSNTYADVFLANGLSVLIYELLQRLYDSEVYRSIEIRDDGAYYVIRLKNELNNQCLDEIAFFRSPAAYLINEGEEETVPTDTNSRNVNDTWEQVRNYAEQRNVLFNQGVRGSNLEAQLQDLEPPYDWQIVAFLGDWRMQAQGIYNRAVGNWTRGQKHFHDHLRALLQLYSSPSVNTQHIFEEWRNIAKLDDISHIDTASQLLNPHQGKGQNGLKANVIRMDNIKDRPWLEEFLKTCGLWYCLTPRQVSDTKDWKAYVLAPRRLNFQGQREAYRTFHKLLWREHKGDTTSLKTDITSLLLFYKAWLDYLEISDPQDDNFDADIARPEDAVSGFYVAQFKLLSQNSYTMINQSFLSLPAWSGTVKTRYDVTEVKALVDEHLDVIHNIDESHSDGYRLLHCYRDFITGENWSSFFDFMIGYAHDILRQYNEGAKWVPTFSITLLRRLFMTSKKPLSPILESQGFQNIAAAIRHSTVIPQYWKAEIKHGRAQGKEQLYEVRYGLGAELKRKSTVRNEFVTSLTDFMQSYNQENSQVYESRNVDPKRQRKNLRTSDIDEVICLVDEYGSELIANLLIAYGYARESREDNE